MRLVRSQPDQRCKLIPRFLSLTERTDCRYHWALLVGPKSDGEDDRRIRYHARDSIGGVWEYEEREIYRATSIMLLARVIVAKVTNVERLQAALRSVPVVQGDESWNCVSWVKNALEAVKVDGKAVGTSNLDWEVVRRTAKEYVQGKKDAHRYDGLGNFDMTRAPTYDLLVGRDCSLAAVHKARCRIGEQHIH